MIDITRPIECVQNGARLIVAPPPFASVAPVLAFVPDKGFTWPAGGIEMIYFDARDGSVLSDVTQPLTIRNVVSRTVLEPKPTPSVATARNMLISAGLTDAAEALEPFMPFNDRLVAKYDAEIDGGASIADALRAILKPYVDELRYYAVDLVIDYDSGAVS